MPVVLIVSVLSLWHRRSSIIIINQLKWFFLLYTKINQETSEDGIGDILVIEGFRFESAASVEELRQLDRRLIKLNSLS